MDKNRSVQHKCSYVYESYAMWKYKTEFIINNKMEWLPSLWWRDVKGKYEKAWYLSAFIITYRKLKTTLLATAITHINLLWFFIHAGEKQWRMLLNCICVYAISTYFKLLSMHWKIKVERCNRSMHFIYVVYYMQRILSRAHFDCLQTIMSNNCRWHKQWTKDAF